MSGADPNSNHRTSTIDTRPLLLFGDNHNHDDNDDDNQTCATFNTSTMSSKTVQDATNQPIDTALKQQRMRTWQPILDPKYAILAYFIIGVVLIPVGIMSNQRSDDVVEVGVQYDGEPTGDFDFSSGCSISSPNEGRSCKVSITVDEFMEAPVMLYYEIQNFHQNYRRYFVSRDDYQLQGKPEKYRSSVTKDFCEPLEKLGDIQLNPCGLVANTLFNDVISFAEGGDGNLKLEEKGIAWKSDVDYRYAQPEGFRYTECSSCDDPACGCRFGDIGSEGYYDCKERYVDSDGTCFLYEYPNDDTTQYLYETYPMVVSPIEGVTNEHFMVWMRTSTLSTFRKLYGYFDQDIAAGTVLTFDISANWEVQSFYGTKTLILSTSSFVGGKNKYLGSMYIITGSIFLGLSVLFGLKQYFSPRKVGDVSFLKFKAE